MDNAIVDEEPTEGKEQALFELGFSVTPSAKGLTTPVNLDKHGKGKINPFQEKVTYNFLRSSDKFIHRNHYMEELDRCMLNALYEESVVFKRFGVVVSGGSGLGKSELVRKYWETHQFQFQCVIWINAESVDFMINDFVEIAQEMGLPLKKPDGSLEEVNSIAQSIYYRFVLRNGNGAHREILFVFDNVENPGGIARYLPDISKTPHILIIPERKYLRSLRFRFIKLSPLSNQTAETFLRKHTKIELLTSQAAIEILLAELEGHPLALNQAVSYMNINDLNVERYLTHFQVLYKQLQQTDFDAYTKRALTTTFLSVEALRQGKDSQHIIDLLNALAYFDGTSIKKGLLLFFLNDRVKLEQALQLLSTYSLIKLQYSQNETLCKEHILTVHRLVQLALKYDHSKTQQTQLRVQQILQTFFKTPCTEKGRYWFRHFIHLYRNKDIRKTVLLSSTKELCKLYDIFMTKGMLHQFLDILLSMESQLKKANNTTTHQSFMQKLAHNLQSRLPNGIDEERMTEDLITTRHLIAKTFSELKQYKEALGIFKNVEQAKMAVLELGERDSILSLLSTQYDIALTLSKLGKHEEAVEVYTRVEQERTSMLGKHHIVVLATKKNFARTLLELRRYQEALQRHRDVAQGLERFSLLGKRHPSVLEMEVIIGQTLSNLGKYKEALQVLKNVEETSLLTQGRNLSHLSIKSDLALTLLELGKYAEALEIFTDIDYNRKLLLQKDHPSLLSTQHNIARTLYELGRYVESIRTYKQVEEKALTTLGKYHPLFLRTKRNIGYTLIKLEQYKDAFTMMKEVEKAQLKVLKSDSPALLITQKRIADALMNLGELKEARDLIKKVSETQSFLFGNDHPKFLESRCSMATILSKLGNHHEALNMFREVEQRQLLVLNKGL